MDLTAQSPRGEVSSPQTALALALLFDADDDEGVEALLAPLSRAELVEVAKAGAAVTIAYLQLWAGDAMGAPILRATLASYAATDADGG